MMNTDLSKKIYLVMIVMIILVAFFLRIYHLDNRPFHHDEGVNSSFLLALIKDGTYNYNPENFHGPLLYYLSYMPISIFGLKSSLIQVDNPELADVSFRLAPAFFGLMMVILMLCLSNWLGRYGIITAMILTALSPSYLFYSRYNIHEIYLITFTLLAFIAGYQYWRSEKNIYIYIAFISLALMFTLKETAIITLGIWVISLCATNAIYYFLNNEKKMGEAGKELWSEVIKKLISPIPITGIIISIFTIYIIFSTHGKLAQKAENYWYFALPTKGISFITFFLLVSFLFSNLRNKTKQILLGSLVFFIIISIFFSSLFTYSKGIASFFIAFEKWLSTGTVESQHTKTFFYYLKILMEFESPILFLGLLGMIFSMQRKDPVIIFTALWAILAFTINSAIPYKTPWLALNIILPLILLAGKFIEDLVTSLKTKTKLTVFGVISILIIARYAYTSIDVSFVNYDNEAKEIVYVHTVRDAKKLVGRTLELTKNYDGDNTKIHITPSDLWPLPWYFRNLTGIMYNDMSDAPIIIINSDKIKELEGKLKERYSTENYQLRPGVKLNLYYQSERGKSFADEYRFKRIENREIDIDRMKPGLKARVFHSINFNGDVIAEKIAETINFHYDHEDEKPYSAPFSILWEGFLYAPENGNYLFATESDDGSWIYIDNKVIVDNGGEHGTQRVEKEVYLEGGYHRIQVKYFDNYFGAIMSLKWRPPNQPEELISSRNLFHIE